MFKPSFVVTTRLKVDNKYAIVAANRREDIN
jgi:hypothetical protein